MKVATSHPVLAKLLTVHPRVTDLVPGPADGVDFWSPSPRQISPQDKPGLGGLIELMDNNPMVCESVVLVPDAASTLLLIGLGPLVQAGLLLEEPTVMTNAPYSADHVSAALQSVDWHEGVTFDHQPQDLGSVYAMTIIAAIRNPEQFSDLDELYAERYDRSLYVRHDDLSPWDTELVANKPHAVYRLRITPGEDSSLLTIQVMADRDGKCGAAQMVHLLNVMCGFEESLGIPDELSAG